MTSKASATAAVVGPGPEGGEQLVHDGGRDVVDVEPPDDGHRGAELGQVGGAARAAGQVLLEAGAPAGLHHPVEILGDELDHLLAGEPAPAEHHPPLSRVRAPCYTIAAYRRRGWTRRPTTSCRPATSPPGWRPWWRRCATARRPRCPAAAARPAARRRSSSISNPTRPTRWLTSRPSCSSRRRGSPAATSSSATTNGATARCCGTASARSTSTAPAPAAPTTAGSSPPPASTLTPK